jgi:alpha-galactosidase
MDRQFLDLVARSGCPLFVSVDPRTVTSGQKTAFTSAMQLALSGGSRDGVEAVDWVQTTCPREWRFGAERVTYRWTGAAGANPARV